MPLRPRLAAAVLAAALAATLAGCSSLPWWMVLQGRSAITDHRHFDNAPIARADTPSPLPAAPQPLRWPGGLSEAGLDEWLRGHGTVALLVWRRGELVSERYLGGHSRDSLFTSFSMAKSVVSALVGIAQAEGRIGSLDTPITHWLPELGAGDPRFGRITLADLLRMRSGIAFEERYNTPWSDVARFYLGPSLLDEVKALKIGREPNRAYSYRSVDTQLLAMALERAVGQPLAAYAEQRLWRPMGAEFDASWSLDSAGGGVARGFCCLNARAVDYLRFGLVFLHEGRWNGRQLVPAEWVRLSTAAQDGLPGDDEAAQRNIELQPVRWRSAFYAWQWRRGVVLEGDRLRPGAAFYAQGQHGQVLVVSPHTQTVLLRLGERNGEVHWASWLQAVASLNRDGARAAQR